VYSLLLSVSLALLVAAGGTLLDIWPWGWGIVFFVLAFVVAQILVGLRVRGKLMPAMAAFQKQVEAGKPDMAMQSLRDMMPLANWVPMLKANLLSSMGAIQLQLGKTQEAVALLQQAPKGAAEARLLLGCIQYRDGDKSGAVSTLRAAAHKRRKHSLLHNTLAWMLHKDGRDDEAIAVLAALTRRDKKELHGKDNLLRLQNKTRMSMQGFGNQWFALGLERPPQSYGQVQQVRKGFRTPPKRKGG
jgi:tetratricopeptide (TPR) repeat protein